MTLRIPQTPPRVDIVGLGPDVVNRVVSHALGEGPTVGGRYLHWEELRRRSPPPGLTLEQWWAALKVARAGAARDVPGLTDVSGNQFRYSLTDPIPERLHQIDLGAGGVIELPDEVTNAQTRDRYIISSLMEESITSSLLEGAGTTRRAAREMLRTNRAPRTRGERMVLNNFLTMRRIQELRREPLVPELVLELHEMVTDGTLDDPGAEGRLRTDQEEVVVGDAYGNVYHRPPSANELADRLARLCKFANSSDSRFVHPVIKAIVLHFWLAYDHPFIDGNGRTARALFYWAMLHAGYWLFEFVSISQAILRSSRSYYRAFLFTESDDNDLSYFIVYHLSVMERAVADLHEYIRRTAREMRETEQRLRGMIGLNHRQKELVQDALRHPDRIYTFESHRSTHGIAYQTARTDLLDLARRKLLQKRKEGRQHVFVAARDLGRRLGA